MTRLRLSHLPKTWLIDIDGVIFKHNEYKILKDGELEKPLPSVLEFFASIPEEDCIILLSARSSQYKEKTIQALRQAGIKFNDIVMDLPTGERILINDTKPSGMKTAYVIRPARDEGLGKIRVHRKKPIHS